MRLVCSLVQCHRPRRSLLILSTLAVPSASFIQSRGPVRIDLVYSFFQPSVESPVSTCLLPSIFLVDFVLILSSITILVPLPLRLRPPASCSEPLITSLSAFEFSSDCFLSTSRLFYFSIPPSPASCSEPLITSLSAFEFSSDCLFSQHRVYSLSRSLVLPRLLAVSRQSHRFRFPRVPFDVHLVSVMRRFLASLSLPWVPSTGAHSLDSVGQNALRSS